MRKSITEILLFADRTTMPTEIFAALQVFKMCPFHTKTALQQKLRNS